MNEAQESGCITLAEFPTGDSISLHWNPGERYAEGLGINVGGHVIVKPLAEWHKLARATDHPAAEGSK